VEGKRDACQSVFHLKHIRLGADKGGVGDQTEKLSQRQRGGGDPSRKPEKRSTLANVEQSDRFGGWSRRIIFFRGSQKRVETSNCEGVKLGEARRKESGSGAQTRKSGEGTVAENGFSHGGTNGRNCHQESPAEPS